jgi:putative NIF3 family GTP cyclohydrolase 1 type 2
MTIQEIFDLAIKMGREADPRPQEEIDKQLARIKRAHEAMPPKQREFFPKEKLTNPYLDSAIHFANDPEKEIKRILVTMDPDECEVLLGKELGVDLVLGHHPIGKSLALLDNSMEMQLLVYQKYGVPINIIQGLMKKRIAQVERSVHVANHYIEPDSARLLKINLMNLHSPADNLLDRFLSNLVNEAKPEFVEDLVEKLFDIPEYQESSLRGTPVKVFTGSPKNYCGKIMIDMTGGTNGSENVYSHLATAGVGTILTMHRPEAHYDIAEKAFISLIVAPHIASDSLGVNLFVDELEKKGIEILPAGGFIRVSRVKDKKGKIANSING